MRTAFIGAPLLCTLHAGCERDGTGGVLRAWYGLDPPMAAEQTIHLERYAPDAKALVAGAQSLADERKHVQVEPIHLLARALDRDKGVAEVFKKAGADPAGGAAEAEAQLSKLPKAGP